MQSTNLINSLQAMYRSARPLIVAEILTNPVTKLEPGQLIQATIQQQVSPGLFKVEVAGQVLQMQLPAQLKNGNVIQLQVMSDTPRLTFSLIASSIPASERTSLEASTKPISTRDQISSTSRFLSNLTELPLERTLIQSAAGKPVWQATGPAIDSKQMAVALKDALGNSGLFYESHQAQWVRGERSTAQLLIEPQNQLQNRDTQPTTLTAPPGKAAIQPDKAILTASQDKAAIQPDKAAIQPDTAAFAMEPDKAAMQPDKTAMQPDKAALALQPDKAALAMQPDKAAADSGLPIAKELVFMVQQQLHTLETHQLTWTGQVWPGQQMQWEIQGEPEHHQTRPDERKWSTEMELALPRLGDVHARLVFSQGGIKLTLHAVDASSIALLNRRLPGLAMTLSDAGIRLTSAVVEKS